MLNVNKFNMPEPFAPKFMSKYVGTFSFVERVFKVKYKLVLPWYATSAATSYLLGFIHLDMDGWILDVEKESPKRGVFFLAWPYCQVKPYEWVCGKKLYEVKIVCFSNKILSFPPLTYALGFSRGGVKDNLTHYVYLQRELEFLLGFDSFPSLWGVLFMWLSKLVHAKNERLTVKLE